MRIYIDSADIAEITEALESGYVYGVTTNPTLLRRASVRATGVPEIVRGAFEAGAKEMHLQTYSDEVQGIVREAHALAELDPERLVVKIPATPAGYAAAAQLTARGLRVTLTAVYTVRQAILSNAVGAHFVAVYLGRMRDQGVDALSLVAQMQRTLDTCAATALAPTRSVEILAASVRAPEEIEALAEIGVATATLPLKVLKLLPESPATAAAASTFLEDTRAMQ